MTTPFERVTIWNRTEAAHWTCVMNDEWHQGRGAYGGVVAGALGRALAELDGDPDRQLRSFHLQCCAPLQAGPAEIRGQLIRRGRSVTYARADMWQEGGIVATSTGTLVRAREQTLNGFKVREEHPAPTCPPPVAVPVARHPSMPPFANHVELRFCLGPGLYAGADKAVTGGWCRLAEPQPIDVPLVLALLDCWPPSHFSVLRGPAAAATVDFTAQILALPVAEGTADAHWLVENRARDIRDGYVEEEARMWSQAGELVATARQVIAIL